MLLLYILGGLLLLLILLLLAPVSVRADCYNGYWHVRIRYLLFWYDISQELMNKREAKAQEKPQKKEKPQKEKPPPKEGEKDSPQKEKPLQTVKMLWELLCSVNPALTLLRNHLTIDKVRVALVIGGEDAHAAALNYARATAALAVLIEIMDGLFVLKQPQTGTVPDFTRPGIRYDISARVRMRPIIPVIAALYILVRYIKLPSRKAAKAAANSQERIRRNYKKQKKQKYKGGNQHEPASYQ